MFYDVTDCMAHDRRSDQYFSDYTETAGYVLSLNIPENTAANTGTALFWAITRRVVLIPYRLDRQVVPKRR